MLNLGAGDDRAALLAQVLVQVVRASARLAVGAARLPAAEGLDAGPRTGGRTGSPVDVDDTSLDPLEKTVDLGLLPGEQPCREAELRRVGPLDRFVEICDSADGNEGAEELGRPEPRVVGHRNHRRLQEVAAFEALTARPAASGENLSTLARLLGRALEALDRGRVDHRPDEGLLPRRVADHERA